jgi:hypothetical protein
MIRESAAPPSPRGHQTGSVPPMRYILSLLLLVCATAAAAQERPKFYLWLEPEWFDGVQGSFAYWTGTAEPTGSWGIAGPGISAEWSQGGESEWNSIGAAAAETKARCRRAIVVPRTGTYRVWIRYVDHRNKAAPFGVTITQNLRPAIDGELGIKPVLPPNDEYQLFWGFAFGWGAIDGKLEAGPAEVVLHIDKAAAAWRQVDAILVTDDLKFVPEGREKPLFDYQRDFAFAPKDGAIWRGSGKPSPVAPRVKLAGKDFTMWTGIDNDRKWWDKQNLDQLKLYDVLFQFAPPADIRDKFHKQFAGRRDLPVLAWRAYVPGLYLGNSPDLSPGTPLAQWLARTKTPFYIMTNYANPRYTDTTGPATYQALTGPFAGQFLGYIHGEAVGTPGVALPHEPLAKDRRGHVDAVAKRLLGQQAEAWSKIYHTPVPPEHWSRGISCLSVDSIALAHLFHDMGARTVGYEIDATNVHAPMRIAFERGAARQYGGAWINYASGNFGDACNYFTQKPVVPRGAGSWFHSKYSITDGVSISWYRKLYYMNFLGGASAIYWEQSLTNQWILPGPGTHPIQLSPFGRATEDFQAFVDRLPDRGEPLTPIAILLGYGHGYEPVSYRCKMLDVFPQDTNDRELRELFNVCWHPSGILEGQAASPDVQSMPGGTYGDIFDILVDRPNRAKAMYNYPVVWAAGDVKLSGALLPIVEDYVRKGGTLVLNVAASNDLLEQLIGMKLHGRLRRSERWSPDGEASRATVPFDVAQVELAGAKVLAWADPHVPLITRHAVGAGAVIVTLMPHLVGLDERAHPAVPWLMNGLTDQLLPIDVRLADGKRPTGEVQYAVNRTKDGYLVALYNHRGIDKTQTGIARVNRRAYTDVVLRTALPIQSAREYTGPRDLAVQRTKTGAEVRLRVPVGDVQVVSLKQAR